MKKTLIVSAIALASLGGALAFAQAPGGGRGGPDGGQRPPFEMSREDRMAILDGRIAGAKAMLRLTPEQEKLWGPVEASLREMSMQRLDMREQRRADRQAGQPTPDADPVKRMKDQATRMQQRSAAMGKLADASAPLYASLDEGQKRRFTMLLRQGEGAGRMGHHSEGRGHHGGHGHFERGPGGHGPGDRGQGDRGPGERGGRL